MAETKRSWYEEVDEICQFSVEISADDYLHLSIADDQVQRHIRFRCTPEEYMNGAMADDQQSIRQLIVSNMSPMVVTEIEQEIKRIIANPARATPKPVSSPISERRRSGQRRSAARKLSCDNEAGTQKLVGVLEVNHPPSE